MEYVIFKNGFLHATTFDGSVRLLLYIFLELENRIISAIASQLQYNFMTKE